MTYHKLILGATFAAAGLLTKSGGDCLVIEPKPSAGHEFLGALAFGTGYGEPLFTTEAAEFYQQFQEKGAMHRGKGCLFDCASLLNAKLLNKNVLLNTSIVDIRPEADGFCVTTHGVKGFRTFRATELVNTLCDEGNIFKKSFHAWVRPATKEAAAPDSVQLEPLFGAFENSYIVKLPVEKDCTYPEARQRLSDVLKNELSGFRLGLSADCFALTPKKTGVFETGGIVQMPSCGFQNPLLAFDAGVRFAERGMF